MSASPAAGIEPDPTQWEAFHGHFGHFFAYAPLKIEYAINRYTMEAKRMMHVLDTQLGRTKYVAGDQYTVADIADWPCFGGLMNGAYNAAA